MPENTPQIRRNFGRNPIKSSGVRINTMVLRHLKKSEERQGVSDSLRTVGLGMLMVAWSIAIAVIVHFIGLLGARYGHHIVMTRAHKHEVDISTAMAITGSFGVLWIIGAVLVAFAITCLATRCLIPKHTFRLCLFGYYRDEEGQDLKRALLINAMVAAIYAAIVAAINFAAMGLLTDMVRFMH